jgi:hypothetical protein
MPWESWAINFLFKSLRHESSTCYELRKDYFVSACFCCYKVASSARVGCSSLVVLYFRKWPDLVWFTLCAVDESASPSTKPTLAKVGALTGYLPRLMCGCRLRWPTTSTTYLAPRCGGSASATSSGELLVPSSHCRHTVYEILSWFTCLCADFCSSIWQPWAYFGWRSK